MNLNFMNLKFKFNCLNCLNMYRLIRPISYTTSSYTSYIALNSLMRTCKRVMTTIKTFQQEKDILDSVVEESNIIYEKMYSIHNLNKKLEEITYENRLLKQELESLKDTNNSLKEFIMQRYH